MLKRAFMAVSGILDSSSTRLRLMSIMVGTCSTATGHSSMQAPQLTQSHTASSVSRRCPIIAISGSFPALMAGAASIR